MTEPIDSNDFGEIEGERAEGEAEMPPAAAKISSSDPALSVASTGRRLRKRAIAVTASIAMGVAAVSLLMAGKGKATTSQAHEETVVTAPAPQSLLDAPDHVANAPALPAAALPAPLPAVPAHESPVANDAAAKEREARRHKVEEEFWKARVSGILVDTGLPAATARASSPRDEESDDNPARAQRSGGGGPGLGGAAPGGGEIFGEDPNMQGRKNRFLSGELEPAPNRRLARIQHLQSPFMLKPGTIIPAALQSAISSDLPGPVIARVTENICDSIHGDWLLIPQGATLVAYYDSMVAWGQERVLMCWKQLELPNGDSVPLGCMPAADWAGQAGLNDQVDEHWWRIVKGAAVSSLLTAGTAAAAGNTVGFNPTLPQLAARGAATEIGNVGQAITRRNIMIQPTLTIRQGQPVNVIINEPLDFSSDTPATPCHSRQEE